MWRIRAGCVLAFGSVVITTGCGDRPPSSARTAGAHGTPSASGTARTPGATGTASADASARPAESALLSGTDLPSGFVPADDVHAFRGLQPTDPDCLRLLALADGKGLDPRDQAYAAYYRAQPAATITERVVPMSRAVAAGWIGTVRIAAQGCRVFRLGWGPKKMRLLRDIRPMPGLGQDTFAVSYAGVAPRSRRIRLDVLMTVVNGHLLIVNQPAVIGRKNGSDLITLAATRAAAKLRAIPPPSPAG